MWCFKGPGKQKINYFPLKSKNFRKSNEESGSFLRPGNVSHNVSFCQSPGVSFIESTKDINVIYEFYAKPSM